MVATAFSRNYLFPGDESWRVQLSNYLLITIKYFFLRDDAFKILTSCCYNERSVRIWLVVGVVRTFINFNDIILIKHSCFLQRSGSMRQNIYDLLKLQSIIHLNTGQSYPRKIWLFDKCQSNLITKYIFFRLHCDYAPFLSKKRYSNAIWFKLNRKDFDK